MILEPVVVNPLAVSKKASTIFGISPVKTNGSPPKNDSKIQLNATVTTPSLAMILSGSGFLKLKSEPMTSKIKIVPA